MFHFKTFTFSVAWTWYIFWYDRSAAQHTQWTKKAECTTYKTKKLVQNKNFIENSFHPVVPLHCFHYSVSINFTTRKFSGLILLLLFWPGFMPFMLSLMAKVKYVSMYVRVSSTILIATDRIRKHQQNNKSVCKARITKTKKHISSARIIFTFVIFLAF